MARQTMRLQTGERRSRNMAPATPQQHAPALADVNLGLTFSTATPLLLRHPTGFQGKTRAYLRLHRH